MVGVAGSSAAVFDVPLEAGGTTGFLINSEFNFTVIAFAVLISSRIESAIDEVTKLTVETRTIEVAPILWTKR
jgi:hypothetical protein